MELKDNYMVEEVIEIVNSLSADDKEKLKTMIFPLETIFKKLVKEDFAKYEATFKALA
jgi:hypothetical protein